MLRELPQNIRLDILLYGNPNSSIEENTAIYESVKNVVIGTKRFSSRLLTPFLNSFLLTCNYLWIFVWYLLFGMDIWHIH